MGLKHIKCEECNQPICIGSKHKKTCYYRYIVSKGQRKTMHQCSFQDMPKKSLENSVLVTGGRNYSDRAEVHARLTSLSPSLVIHGNARGADTLAKQWANEHGVHSISIDALWKFYGNSAGPYRNTYLVAVAKALNASVLAFPGGVGTKNCCTQALSAGLIVTYVQ